MGKKFTLRIGLDFPTLNLVLVFKFNWGPLFDQRQYERSLVRVVIGNMGQQATRCALANDRDTLGKISQVGHKENYGKDNTGHEKAEKKIVNEPYLFVE